MATPLRRLALTGSLALLCTSFLFADPARFDLTGPRIEVRVTRGSVTLPIASVPNLQPGDKLWIHPDLPATQSAHLLLVATFLRGTTNPPPDKWFTKLETWNKRESAEGITLVVPEGAEQAILFLAPETGGDFSTLRSAVQGRPGIFVRASQDLAEAGFEQARIEKYLAEIKQVPPSDPKALLDHSNLLARTLSLKPNEECFKRPVDQQYNCLTQTGSQTLLDDGHGQTVVAQLTNGPGSDFINAASTTSLAGGGVYSAYVGAIVDLVRITSNLHTAHYQYIPAIAFPDQQNLNLRLNTPPSFHNPKSVIVIGLPSIQKSTLPPLRPADPKHVTCLLAPELTLPVEGAPLVFSTALAHDMSLHLDEPNAPPDIPLAADPFRGGLVPAAPDTRRKPLPTDANPTPATPAAPGAKPAVAGKILTGTVHGFWGFDAFTGPTLTLQHQPGRDWRLVGGGDVIAGQKAELRLTSTGTGCLDTVTFPDAAGKQLKADWKPTDTPNEIALTLPLYAGRPGDLMLHVRQFGEVDPAQVAVKSFARPSELSAIEYFAGDHIAKLTGSDLAEVRDLRIGSLLFQPAKDASSSPGALTLTLAGSDPLAALHAGEHLEGRVSLEDGRILSAGVTVQPARPVLHLLGKSYTLPQPSPIQLASKDDLPLSSHLTFALRADAPMTRDGVVELSSEDGSLNTKLSIAGGSLVLEDAHTVLAELDPEKLFGRSAFGPLRIRLVSPGGPAGDWIPLGTLVRLPGLSQLRCPASSAAAGPSSAPCTLTGSALYLIQSIALDAAFSNPIDVPEGFVGDSLPLSQPIGPSFYVRLRDDPSQTDAVIMPKPAK